MYLGDSSNIIIIPPAMNLHTIVFSKNIIQLKGDDFEIAFKMCQCCLKVMTFDMFYASNIRLPCRKCHAKQVKFRKKNNRESNLAHMKQFRYKRKLKSLGLI